MIKTCDICAQDFLIESDPHVVFPRATGTKIYCWCQIRPGGSKERLDELERKVQQMTIALQIISGMYPGGEKTFFNTYKNFKTGTIAREALNEGGEKALPSDLQKEARWQELSIQKDYE